MSVPSSASLDAVQLPVSPSVVSASSSAAITVPTSSVSHLLVRTETISATSSVAPATVRSVVVPSSTPDFVDAHCHLDRLMSRVAPAFGVFPFLRVMVFRNLHLLACVTNFCDVTWLLRHEGLFADFLSFDRVYGIIGCHPSGASELSHRADKRLRCLLQHAKVMPWVSQDWITIIIHLGNNEDARKKYLEPCCPWRLRSDFPWWCIVARLMDTAWRSCGRCCQRDGRFTSIVFHVVGWWPRNG